MLARISKAKPWTVVCGVRDPAGGFPCGTHLAYIVFSRQDPPRRLLIMAPDWGPRYADRVWARKKRQTPRGHGSDYRQCWVIKALPVDIACSRPGCGQRQTLSNEVLHVDAEDIRTFAGIPATCRTTYCRGQSLPGEACPRCHKENTRRPEPGHPVDLIEFYPLLDATIRWYTASNINSE